MSKRFAERLEALERATPALLPGVGSGHPIRFSLVDGAPVYTRTDAPGWDGAIVEASLAGLRAWADDALGAINAAKR